MSNIIPNEMYQPITIVSEDEHGRLGVEEWEKLTMAMLIARCRELSDIGWEPQEVQAGEAQSTLHVPWWVDKRTGAK